VFQQILHEEQLKKHKSRHTPSFCCNLLKDIVDFDTLMRVEEAACAIESNVVGRVVAPLLVAPESHPPPRISGMDFYQHKACASFDSNPEMCDEKHV